MKHHKYRNMLVVSILTLFSGLAMTVTVDEKTKQRVIQTLVKKFDVTQEQIVIVNAEHRNWPSSALGCAEKGQYYLPVITPGYLLQIEVKSKLHQVHTSEHAVIVCEEVIQHSAKKIQENKRQKMSLQVRAMQLAREKLLSTDQVSSGKAKLISITSKAWLELKQHCSENSFFEESSSGYLIVLKGSNKQASFFSDGSKVVECRFIKKTKKGDPKIPN